MLRAADRNSKGFEVRKSSGQNQRMIDSSRIMRRLAESLLVVLIVGCGLHAGSNPIAGSDLWWAMATGRYITEHREIPQQDVFSYTYDGAPWFNQEWLTQVLFFQTFRIFGPDALAILKIAIVLVTFLLAAWIAWRRSGSLVFTAFAVGTGALVCFWYLDIRPQLFTFLGTLVVIAITDEYRRGARPWVLGLLPLTLLLWVNLHFGFIFGLCALALIAGCEIAKSVWHWRNSLDARRSRLLAAAAAASAIACLFTPRPLRAFAFPFSVLGPENIWRMVLEWHPARLFIDAPFNPALFGYLLTLTALAFLAVLAVEIRKIDLTDLALVVVTAAMALQARRFIPLFTLVSIPFLATCLATLANRLPARHREVLSLGSPRSAVPTALLALGCLVALGWTFVDSVKPRLADGLFNGMTYATFFPKGAVEFLRTNTLPARIYNLYNWGGYLEYWLPDRKVFIDGRANTVYPSAFYIENLRVHRASDAWESILRRRNVSLVLWPNRPDSRGDGQLLAALQRSPNWSLIYGDDTAVLFAHVVRGREWIENSAPDSASDATRAEASARHPPGEPQGR